MRIIASLLFILSWVGVPIDRAQACSCAPASLDSRFQAASVVFEGRLIREEVVSREQRTLHFLVTRQWKGELHEHQVVQTSRHEISCGFTGQLSVYYLIFAHRNEAGELSTSLCSGNQTADSAEAQAFAQRHGGAVTPVRIAPGATSEEPAVEPLSPARAGCQSCTLNARTTESPPFEVLLALVMTGLLLRRRRR